MNNILGKRLKDLRLKNGKLQKDIANYLNISDVAYGYYEKGERQPNPEVLLKLANYFNVTTDYLLGRIDDDLLNVKKRMRDNNLHGFFDIGLDKYDELSEEQQKIIIKQLNAMIDIFLEEKDK